MHKCKECDCADMMPKDDMKMQKMPCGMPQMPMAPCMMGMYPMPMMEQMYMMPGMQMPMMEEMPMMPGMQMQMMQMPCMQMPMMEEMPVMPSMQMPMMHQMHMMPGMQMPMMEEMPMMPGMQMPMMEEMEAYYEDDCEKEEDYEAYLVEMEKNYPDLSEEAKVILKKLMELDFAILDLNLYLDTHPTDRRALDMYNRYICMREPLVKRLEVLYGPLTPIQPIGYPWKWLNQPWPWRIQF